MDSLVWNFANAIERHVAGDMDEAAAPTFGSLHWANTANGWMMTQLLSNNETVAGSTTFGAMIDGSH